jgi:hypothetical protein
VRGGSCDSRPFALYILQPLAPYDHTNEIQVWCYWLS